MPTRSEFFPHIMRKKSELVKYFSYCTRNYLITTTYLCLLDDVDAVAMTLADLETKELQDPCLSYVSLS